MEIFLSGLTLSIETDLILCFSQIAIKDESLSCFSRTVYGLTPKTPITTAADDIHKCFFIFFRKNKT